MPTVRRKAGKPSGAQLQLEIDYALAELRGHARVAKYRPAVAYPAELEQARLHFASGVNHAGEVRGLAMSGRHYGITANRASAELLREVEAVNHNGGPRLFVDSGAFSEVKFGPGGPRVVKAITDEEWRRRLKLYAVLAKMYGPRCYLVAPDQVGNQQVTLERLARYAPQIALCASLRAHIIVPVQKGALPMSEFYRQACAILGLRNAPIAGVPMKKDATSLAQLAELVDSMPWHAVKEYASSAAHDGCRIHLLGLGPESKRWPSVLRTIKSRRPNASITSDSVTVRRLAGRTNGPKGGPRVLTKYNDEARAILAGDGVLSPFMRGGTKSTVAKAYALSKQGGDEARRERKAATAAGWFDEELYDSAEEAAAHAAAGYPEKD